jgi:hypothetical protein
MKKSEQKAVKQIRQHQLNVQLFAKAGKGHWCAIPANMEQSFGEAGAQVVQAN